MRVILTGKYYRTTNIKSTCKVLIHVGFSLDLFCEIIVTRLFMQVQLR